VDENLITTLGATAIARVLPTNPCADITNFLGELRSDGLPGVKPHLFSREKYDFFRNLGDDYLNVEFGWKPFVADLLDFAGAAKNSEKILAQYVRDSGRGVRRQYRFPPVESTVVSTVPSQTVKPVLSSYIYRTNPSATITKTTVTKREYWFSGCFVYYLDPGDTAMGRAKLHAQLAEKLFGAEITPESLWNLAPWSWAVDWVLNVGDVIHNLVAFQQDGLVMRYGYMMAQTTITNTYTIGFPGFYIGEGPNAFSQTFGTIQKVRRKATPYGFGLTFSGFSLRQLAILAALGLTKSPIPVRGR